MLRHWRKITVTNREQNRLEVYCMDETTVPSGNRRHDPIFPRRPLASQPTDFTAVMPMQTARLFEERDGIVAIPIHLGPESNRGRGAFDTRLIRHERVADEPALQWLRGLFAVHAHREDPKAKTGAFRAFRRRRFRPDRT